jgi:purine nucleosidase
MDVILVHDAAIDEYMSQLLLQTMPGINLLGVVIVNADCIDSAAMQTAWQVQTYIGNTTLPMGLSRARGWNAFPWSYRSDCVKMSQIQALLPYAYAPNPAWPPFPDGDALLRELLTSCAPGVTLLITCPFTPLAMLMESDPDLVKKIGQVIWMGGAIYVGGNLDPTTVPTPPWNGCAEWNAFWDADSVDAVFRGTTMPIVQFPLDMTNQASVAPSFMTQLQTQAAAGSRWSELAFQAYSLVAKESFYDMWDVVTTCWLANTGFFQPPSTLSLAIDTRLDTTQGCIKPVASGGREVSVVLNFASGGQAAFYDYVAGQFNR